MSVTYITADGSLAVLDQQSGQLDSYHDPIRSRLDDGTELIGLTGSDKGVRRVIVSQELGETAITDIEDYIGVQMVIDETE